ncbi:methyltransferase type 12 [Mycobacterium antarcticum]|nr:methyltransferase type 12 [Mycolicibacterium sp. TUM20985]
MRLRVTLRGTDRRGDDELTAPRRDGAGCPTSHSLRPWPSSVVATAEGTASAPTVDLIYRAAARGADCWARNHHGQVRDLPMTRWFAGPNTTTADQVADDHILAHCSERPTLDVGCGPGRFTAALQRRGHAALGVDTSQAAVDLTRARGGTALRADVFGPLPAEGCWDHILLADGNIGIGGDPVKILRRVADLLAPGGSVIAEIDSRSPLPGREMLRWETEHQVGHWFPWSRVGPGELRVIANTAGLNVAEIVDIHSRIIAVLTV